MATSIPAAVPQPTNAARWASRLEGAVLIGAGLMIGVEVFISLRSQGGLSYRWDWLFLSGLLLFLAGALLARTVPSRVDGVLARLVDREVLAAGPEDMVALRGALASRAEYLGHRAGLIVAVLLAVATIFAFGPEYVSDKLVLVVVELATGYVAGRYLGRMATYGSLGGVLEKLGIKFRVHPGHLDGAAGLQPLGEFYFFQALLVSLPAAFLAVWWVLIPLWPVHWYELWREAYLGLLVPAIIFEVLAFLVPMWSFHTQMLRQKADLLRQADALGVVMEQMQVRLAESNDGPSREVLKDRLAAMRQLYRDIEHLPTWPVDTRTWRRFALNNLALLLPLASRLVGAETVLGGVLRQFGEVLKQPPA
jgi:hypothetical protein